jgi:two-component sensor histidine kinase
MERSPKSLFLDFVYQPIIDDGDRVTGIFVEGMDVTEHVETENRWRLLNDELKHRVKNTIAVISAIATQTLRGKVPELDEFNARLKAFARAHDILTSLNQTSASVSKIVEDALVPHRPGTGRFHIGGPHMALGSHQALSLSLALHELATNAAKYGALSTDDGKVRIAWRKLSEDAQELFEFVWEESDGPPVTKPSRTGFGSKLVQRILPADFGGTVEVSYASTGVSCRLTAPLENCCPPSE